MRPWCARGLGMASLELNKIAAGVLCAGLLAMASGQIAGILVSPKMPEQNAYEVDTSAVGDGATAPAKSAGPVLEPVMALLADADPQAGLKVFKKCAACHTTDSGGANRVGPNLWNIVGGAKGARDGFGYSSALTNFEGTQAWDYASLNAFLASPKTYMPGTKMTFVGLRKVSDRANVIAYLRTIADTPAPLPTPDDIANEETAAGG